MVEDDSTPRAPTDGSSRITDSPVAESPVADSPVAESRVADEQGSRWRRWSVLLPALTFLAGLLLGGAVIGATSNNNPGSSAEKARPSATPTPTPTPSDLLVRVPGPCLQAADEAQQAYALVEQGVKAARDLDARALADIVAQVQKQRPQVQALVDSCRAASGNAIVQPAPTTS